MGASRLALALAGLGAVAAVTAALPNLSRAHWIVGLAVRETSLLVAVVAVVALVLARTGGGGQARLVRWLAVPAGAWGLAVFAVPLAAFPDPGRFSLKEYILGPLAVPEVEVRRDLDLGAPLRGDLYAAPGPGPHPFVVLLHGGSWRGGDKGELAHVPRALAAAGFSVVDATYRLAGTHPFPAAVIDAKRVLARLRARAAALGLDPGRAALMGRSAGGQVALVAAYSQGDPALAPGEGLADQGVRAAIALYAPLDLAWGHDNPMRPDIVRGTESLEVYLGGDPRQAAEAYRRASPASWVGRPLPPTLLVHGTADQIVRAEHSRRLDVALRGAGADVELVLIRFGDHGMDARPGSVSEQRCRHALIDFLRRTL